MKNKIFIFILVFCLCFLCFVIPSFASDNVSEASTSGLIGTTWIINTERDFNSLGLNTGTYYSIEGVFTTGANTTSSTELTHREFKYLYYGGSFVRFHTDNIRPFWYNSITNSSASVGYDSADNNWSRNLGNIDELLTYTFTGGSDIDNPSLISWLNQYAINVTAPQTGIIEAGWDYMTSPPSFNLPPILVRPDPSFIPVGGSYVFEGVGTYYLDNGLPYVFTHFAWELTSYTDIANYTLEFQVQRESGVWVTLYTFVVQSGTQTIVFYPEIDYFVLNTDIEVDIDSYNLFYSHFAPQLEGGIDDPDDFTDNPWLYIIEMVIEALKYPIWGYFSPWDIVTTISGIFIVTWLLKLIAGG